jgi:hypothetical protein
LLLPLLAAIHRHWLQQGVEVPLEYPHCQRLLLLGRLRLLLEQSANQCQTYRQ